MTSVCAAKKCKAETAARDNDKSYQALLARMKTITNAVLQFNTIDPSTKDVEKVKSLTKQLEQCMKDKYKIEAFHKAQVCQFEKCRRDIDDMIDKMKSLCTKDMSRSKVCPHLNGKIDLERSRKLVDMVQLEIIKGFERDMIAALKKKK
jgi:hypothetical protein